MDDNDLERLLTRARARDTQALGDLLSHLWQQAHNRAGAALDAQLRVRLGASDAAQEACLRAHRAFSRFRGNTAAELRAWFAQIVRRCVADAGRAHGPQIVREEAGECHFDDLSDGGSSPSQQAIAAERHAHVTAALSRLPEHYQQVIRLRTDEQLPFAEVARQLAVSEGNARVLFLRAVQRLRDELAEST